jgi:hypothetical protein
MSKRLAFIADLNRAALRATRQSRLTLELDHDPSAADRVRDLVRLEESCCAFLRFEVEDRSDVVRLRVIAPPEAGVAAKRCSRSLARAASSTRTRTVPPDQDSNRRARSANAAGGMDECFGSITAAWPR